MRKKLLFALLSLLLLPLGLSAQTVHIGLDNGSMVTGYGPGNDSGWEQGFATTWRHEQLSLSMMASDRDKLKESGEIGYPSNVFAKHRVVNGNNDKDGQICIIGGRRPSFIVVSLPKGYRITGYTIVLSNDLQNADFGGRFNHLNNIASLGNDDKPSNDYGTMRFYEVKRWKTNETNSGTDRPQSEYPEEDGNGYYISRVKNIAPGPNWQGDEIGSEVITWAKQIQPNGEVDNNNNIEDIETADIKTTDTKGTLYKISRTAQKTDQVDEDGIPIYDMGNQLYFRLVKDYCFYGITIKEFRIDFTAEGTFAAEVAPDAIGIATSCVASPFKTSKIDLGELKDRTKTSNGRSYTHYAFDYDEIDDIKAFNYLYQDDAIAGGAPADVATNKNILPVEVDGQMLYALKSDTYFLEPPIQITSSGGNVAPIGYRIVGALFTPLWGTQTSGQPVNVENHNITFISGNRTYFLNAEGRFTRNNTHSWEEDANFHVHSGDNYLAYSNVDGNRTLSIITATNITEETRLISIDNDGHLYYTDTNDDNTTTTYYLQGTTNSGVAPSMTTGTGNQRASWTENTESQTSPTFTPGSYRLKIWKRDGSGLMHWTRDDSGYLHPSNNQNDPDYIEIEDEEDDDLGKVIDVGSFNNDAIKFEIETTGNNAASTQALVQIKLLLQALDPYINKMDINCTDDADVLHLTQSFTSDDFSVSGGKFVFYVPTDYADDWLHFSFSDLYSNYGDETYYKGGPGSSRYSFVNSSYFAKFDGNEDDGLYANNYDPNWTYEDKVYTDVAGNIRFKFNNAEDLANENGRYLEETPFSVTKYLSTTDPGDPLSNTQANPNKPAAFVNVTLKADEEATRTGTYFVFTADETRWNIADTHAWQHRFYAFYRMEIEAVARTFTPKYTLTKIYDKTFYDKNGTNATDSMWGLTLDVEDTGTGEEVDGYLTYQEIIDVIQNGRAATSFKDQSEVDEYNAGLNGALNSTDYLTAEQATAYNNAIHPNRNKTAGEILTAAEASAYNATLPGAKTLTDPKTPYVPPVLKQNAAEGPTDMKQILYIDGTPLYAMVNSSPGSDVITVKHLRNELAPNSLVFLPENTTSTEDNVAFYTSSGFRAGGNIVLKDKQPFYTPYEIRIDAANYVTYSRKISNQDNGKVTNATVLLPFTLKLDESGMHTNPIKESTGSGEISGEPSGGEGEGEGQGNTDYPGSGLQFVVNQLASSKGDDEIKIVKTGSHDFGTAYFRPLSNSGWTRANVPYMIKVPTEGAPEGDFSFIVTQMGSLIERTPNGENYLGLSEEDSEYDEKVGLIEKKGYNYTGNVITGDVISPVSFDGYHAAFTNYTTYSGATFKHDVETYNEDIFYFAKDEFFNVHELYRNLDLLIYPFRAIYGYEPTGASREFPLMRFRISYEEPEGSEITGINDNWKTMADLMIRSEKGSMIITATRAQDVTIYSTNGTCMAKVSMKGGDTQTVNLPTGLYVVNNVKIAVK